MRLYTDKAVFQGIGERYLRVVGLAYPFTVMSAAMSALLRSTEKVRIPFYGAIAGVAAGVALYEMLRQRA